MITGENGFLFKQLQGKIEDSDDLLFLLGSPTYDFEIERCQANKLFNYVQETIDLINKNMNKYIVFASSTGVTDIDFEHKGMMTYTLAKLYLENYIIQNCNNYVILRIGTIVSNDLEIIKQMKGTRIQKRILMNNIKGIPMNDEYLDLNQFINETCDIINNKKQGIHHYQLQEMSLFDLRKYTI